MKRPASKIKIFFAKLSRTFNPLEWQMKLLGLKIVEEDKRRRGLILLQIDGLSHPDFQRALHKGHLPFLRRLMRREGYELRPMYSGLPSNTPAFQGEFFFGQRQCVPAFQFLDRESGKIFTMFEKSSAETVEKKLLEQGEGLMKNGSAYGNIFSGGAAEAHVCASNASWKGVVKTWNPYSILITFLMSPYAMVRGIFLCVVEVVLSVIDVLRGVFSGHDIIMEIGFILSRVFSSVLVREMATAHARMDIYRGLPVIQVNYFGYDEQAHRRGPSTRFAYWSLSGIDASIRKIWRAAARAKSRHYDVWIYSDHGQETCVPFTQAAGQSIQHAVQKVYDGNTASETEPPFVFRGRRTWGDMAVDSMQFVTPADADKVRPTVTTLGPIAQIYFPSAVADVQKKDFSKKLIARCPAIPLIAIPLENGEVEYRNARGTFYLPQNAAEVLGPKHPYAEAVMEDLKTLLKHEKRGDLMIFGWAEGMKSVSFSNENGSHAGLGPIETQAFALVPADVPLHPEHRNFMRGYDLRQAALLVLGKKTERPKPFARDSETRSKKLRVMSYNVHCCVGLDGILSTERIARVIAKSDPDIVALQELDAGRKTYHTNQAELIAKELEMHFHFHAVCGADTQCFGNAILSRYPMRVLRSEHFPTPKKSYLLEPRGLLWVEIDFPARPIQIITTHLSVWSPELELQIKKLLGPEILGREDVPEDLIVCGDFNMSASSKFHCMMNKYFREPRNPTGKAIPNTWMSPLPFRRYDYIFMKGNLNAEFVPLPRTSLEAYASDHLPIIADFEVDKILSS